MDRPFVAAVGAARPPFWRAALSRLNARGTLVVAVSCFVCELLVRASWSQAPMPVVIPLLSRIVLYGVGATSLYVAVMAADEAIARGARQLAAYGVAIACGAALGAGLDYLVRDVWFHPWREIVGPDDDLVRDYRSAWGHFFNFAIYGALATFVYVTLRAARDAASRRNERELARQQALRRTVEARLSAMQARIEPQFLFNTLGQVRALYDTDAGRGGAMLDHLITYLRAALPQLRDTASTLGREAALANAYLDIVRMRCGDRLRFAIDIAARLDQARVPPMMLLPLIEHALEGTGPAEAIGLRIGATGEDRALRLQIETSSSAFADRSAAADLDHITERLHALYGDQARLRLERSGSGASRAVLEIPHEQADRSDR